MLIGVITKEFNTYLEQDLDRNTILWFDPKREWEGLLPHLQPHLPLLIFEGSQLHLRYQLVSRAQGQWFVVYLPMKRDEAAYMRPFFYTSRIFDASIEATLRACGIPLPDAPGAMRSLRPLLPALAVASVGKGRAFWEGIVNLETALAHLIPDFDDLLLRLLAAPSQAMAELEGRKVAGPFLDLLEAQFGVAPPRRGEETRFSGKNLVSEMNEWVDRFTATLCLVDTYVSADQPADFPFRSALPDPVHWDRCRNFLHKWQRDEMFKDVFARRARAIDGQYALAGWVKALSSPPTSSAFLNVERTVWDGVRARLDAIADKPQAVAFCRAQRDTFRERSQGFWAREGSLAGWAALDRMAEVVIGAADALAELGAADVLAELGAADVLTELGAADVLAELGAAVEQAALGQEESGPAPSVHAGAAPASAHAGAALPSAHAGAAPSVHAGATPSALSAPGPATPQALIERYTQAWWRVDRAYRRFRAELNRGVGHLDSALKWARRIYGDFLETVNGCLVQAMAREGHWPPGGMALGPGDLWKRASTKGQGRRAVVIADALRYELGQELAERLQPGTPAAPDATLSPLPSVTALGMAALLPGWPDFQVDFAGGQWVITAPGFEGNLAVKAHRLAWLVQHLGSAAVFDLDRWLSTPLGGVAADADWIVVTSTEIDALGEGTGAVAWHALDALLDRLEQAVRRLLALGCSEVHVVSDHGFLLRDDVREADKVTVDVEGVLKKADRYLVGRDLPLTEHPELVEGLPAMPVPGSDGLVAWFPRGIGCFATPGPYDFMHGGISLQELVTAHVTVRQSVAERPVGVALELVAGPDIRNAIFKVRLTPVGVDLLSRARPVKIDIARQARRVSREWKTVIDRDEVEMSLRLDPDSGLAVGDAVAIRVWDAVTGELLAQQPATVYVSLDW